MESVLNKGLNCCPAKKGVNYTQLLADLFRLERKMAWRHFYHDAEEEEQPGNENEKTSEIPFKDKMEKRNLPREYPKEISDLVNSVRSDLIVSEENKYSNLTKEEWEAIEKLNKFQKEGQILIQPADKMVVFVF